MAKKHDDNKPIPTLKGGIGKPKTTMRSVNQVRQAIGADRPPFREPAIIIHGPAGIGKTRFIPEIAALFGKQPESVVDDWQPGAIIEPGHIYLAQHAPPQSYIETLGCLAVIAIDVRSLRLSPIAGSGIPVDNPFTCGTRHLAAQATLTLAMRNQDFAEGITAGLLQELNELVTNAGWQFAADIVRRGRTGPSHDDLPF